MGLSDDHGGPWKNNSVCAAQCMCVAMLLQPKIHARCVRANLHVGPVGVRAQSDLPISLTSAALQWRHVVVRAV